MHITMRDACSIMTKDLGEKLESNVLPVYLACNLHCMITEHYAGPSSAKLLAFRLKVQGMKSVSSGLNSLFYRLLANSFEFGPIHDDDLYTICMETYERSGAVGVSQVCRFLKRFTYNDIPDDPDTYQKFLDTNTGCWSDSLYRSTRERGGDATIASKRGKQRVGQTLLQMVKSEIQDMVGEAPSDLYEHFEGSFSSGASADGAHCLMDRIRLVTNYDPMYQGWHDGGLYRCNAERDAAVERRQIIGSRDAAPECKQVPKSMDSKRLICPEPAERAFRSSKVLEALRQALRNSGADKFINEHDQSVNRGLARLGSVLDFFASMDLTSASDSISRCYLIEVFPESWRPYLIDSVSDAIIVQGNRVPIKCFSTSGNKLTWLTAAIYFLGLTRVATRWVMLDEENRIDFEYLDMALKVAGAVDLPCFAYGDDLIVHTAAYEAVCELLELFGCIVNRDKSYAVGAFRESCGGDYYAGTDITPVYWPRRPMSFTPKELPKSLAALCELQHALYDIVDCRMLINDTVLRLAPETTFSPIGAECSDLWDGCGTIDGHHTSVRVHYHKRRKLRYHNGRVVGFADDYTNVPRAFMEWQYYEFLRRGPRYLTESDEAWGISSSYLADADMDGNPSYTWR